MKLKSILLTAVATISLATATMAQVPNYVPTNGLVGWWPFNGNANDESGNGFNGTASNVSPVNDRFSNPNSAYSFNGNNSKIDILNFTQNPQSFSINLWFNASVNGMAGTNEIMHRCEPTDRFNYCWNLSWGIQSNQNYLHSILNTNMGASVDQSGSNLPINSWQMATMTFDGTSKKIFINGVLADSTNLQGQIIDYTNKTGIFVGYDSQMDYFNGKIDDIGIWNRALTAQEITNLFNSVNCANNTSITPQTNSLATGSTATFTATTSAPNPSYAWQSDLGQGFQTLNNFGNYSGVNSATLNIANVQLSEHNQPIRVISTSGNCVDTSNIATISITDTCIVTINDTITTLISVTDTLIINTTVTGLTQPNNLNTIKVFPNPANDHITINYGNFASMSGYTLKITNNLGQVVFTSPINQQSSYIDLSTWTGNGIYFVQIIDPQNNTIENRKIVIQ
jgi:hypothetical protein